MSDESKTTTILTIDLPPELGHRLRDAVFESGRSLNAITVEALEEWLQRQKSATDQAA